MMYRLLGSSFVSSNISFEQNICVLNENKFKKKKGAEKKPNA